MDRDKYKIVTLKVLSVSSWAANVTVQIIAVKEFPPNEDCRIRVNLESRKLMYLKLRKYIFLLFVTTLYSLEIYFIIVTIFYSPCCFGQETSHTVKALHQAVPNFGDFLQFLANSPKSGGSIQFYLVKFNLPPKFFG